ncbi:hypothetical protein OESDEN_14059 [Oesophagostomum dentatum]|uniref:Uncharacterized protein n=1 Tax=Oesophagostomum dentatum TaxID=61180 RepID=A0A0B1SMP8_OESDE|nr:hypothetical protein OESDEN_14059 [Oesophagostomum dentatum]
MLTPLVILFALLIYGLRTANGSKGGREECDSSCTLSCGALSNCILVPTDGCPKATCQSSIQFLFGVEPPPDSGSTTPS